MMNWKEITGASVGATVFFMLGSSTGVALLGTAVNGAVIFTPIGALVGFLAVKAYLENKSTGGE